MTGRKIKPLIINHSDSYDIDTMHDLEVVKSLVSSGLIKI